MALIVRNVHQGIQATVQNVVKVRYFHLLITHVFLNVLLVSLYMIVSKRFACHAIASAKSAVLEEQIFVLNALKSCLCK